MKSVANVMTLFLRFSAVRLSMTRHIAALMSAHDTTRMQLPERYIQRNIQ